MKMSGKRLAAPSRPTVSAHTHRGALSASGLPAQQARPTAEHQASSDHQIHPDRCEVRYTQPTAGFSDSTRNAPGRGRLQADQPAPRLGLLVTSPPSAHTQLLGCPLVTQTLNGQGVNFQSRRVEIIFKTEAAVRSSQSWTLVWTHRLLGFWKLICPAKGESESLGAELYVGHCRGLGGVWPSGWLLLNVCPLGPPVAM